MENKTEHKRYSLLPFVSFDGVPTMTDSQIMELFHQTKKDGLVEVVFCNGKTNSPESFLAMAKRPECLFFMFFYKTHTIGYAGIENIIDRRGEVYFCFFNKFTAHAVPFTKYFLNAARNLHFDVLIGGPPLWNQRAIRFEKAIGWQPLGVLPKAVWNHRKQESQDVLWGYYEIKPKNKPEKREV